jgi:DNA repair protein RecO (recombination protein O)
MTERQFRTQAIILRRREWRESDRMLTILTPAHGKLDVVAKGARKLNNPKTGHVELFTRSDMLIHNMRTIPTVVQCETIAPYLNIREDLMLGGYANYIVEMLDRFTMESALHDTDARLFDLLQVTLERLCDERDPRLAVRYYEVRLLDLAGFRPDLHTCAITGAAIQAEDQHFSYMLGGVVSPTAARADLRLVPISLNTLKVLRHLQRSEYEQVRDLKIDHALHDQIERISLGYVTAILERRLQSVDFIQKIRRTMA